MMQDPMGSGVSDDMLIQAMRQRILDNIQEKEDMSRIVNNIYGQQPQQAGPSSVYDSMQGQGGGEGGMSPEQLEYFVDISRQNNPIDEETGKSTGWTKKVHRYTKRKEDDERKKKRR